ncbi:MAG: 3-deoxy-manno-octulosonate cytidylyltransferase [Ignavibacteria bacterium]|nr:3-deoxy-manno-octulosonate cytidylyltransferase [Ignavibacteria bacterium]
MKSKKAKGKKGLTVIGIIPVRYGSTRLPAKALAMIQNKPMIQHVYERCLKSKLLDEILVATDDKRIYNTVIKFGGNAVITSKNHKSGSDRVGEAVKNIICDIVVNIQGDEPLIDPRNIDKAIVPLLNYRNINISTLCIKIKEKKEITNPNIVKVVKDINNNALYFSRSVIPFNRDGDKVEYYKHIGLYVYRRKYLLNLAKPKPSKLEIAEKLEQLRILENGNKIHVVEVKKDSFSVDTLSDLKKVRNLIIK